MLVSVIWHLDGLGTLYRRSDWQQHREHIEWQQPHYSVHSIMMEKSAQAGDGGGGGCTTFCYIYDFYVQKLQCVRFSWEGRNTPPISSLFPGMYSVGRSINDTYASGCEVWCRAQWKSLKGSSSSGLSASLVNQDPHEKKTRTEKDPRVFHSGNRARVNHARASAGGFMYMAKCEAQKKMKDGF